MTALLEVHGADKRYAAPDGSVVHALRSVDLSIPDAPPTIVTVAGESGSGKTTLAQAILGLVPLSGGSITYRGRELSTLDAASRRKYRREVQAVFQDPYGAFNPFYKVRHPLELSLRNFRVAPRAEHAALMADAVKLVGLDPAVLDKHPHQLSGGQRQRLMFARAYLLRPRLVVADEPVSMVDASLRRSILDVMRRMRDEEGISFIYITHDLATAYEVSDRLLLMLKGAVVEDGPTASVVERPQHPYARLLMESVPSVERRWPGRIEVTGARVGTPEGCGFYHRCPVALDACRATMPPLEKSGDRRVACYADEQSRQEGAA